MQLSINTDLPNRLFKRLEKVSKETKKSQSYIVKKAIENYIYDYNDLNIALKRMNDDNDELVSLQDMRISFDI